MKGIIFIALALALALFIESKLDNPFEQVEKLDRALSEKSPDIIYFGDSSVYLYAPNDPDRRSIASFLAGYSGREIVEISHAAYHLGIYEAYSEYVCNSENRPKLAIVPINLRVSFSEESATRPAYQFNNQIRWLKSGREGNTLPLRLWLRFYHLFGNDKEKESRLEEEWKSRTVYYNATPRGKVSDYLIERPSSSEEVAGQFIFEYMPLIGESHGRISSLKKMVMNYESCGVKLLLYTSPIDYESGIGYIGSDFTAVVGQNIKTIQNSVKNSNVVLVDMSFDLNASYFNYISIPNEHLKQDGREYVARKLSMLLDEENR